MNARHGRRIIRTRHLIRLIKDVRLIKDAFPNALPSKPKLFLTHAKWLKTESGYKLYESPYPHQSETRRIYMQWQWTDNGDHPRQQYGSQYVPRELSAAEAPDPSQTAPLEGENSDLARLR